MFFVSITNISPATTEVVAEVSAILPNRGDHNQGELDFYANSSYFYCIELMREGNDFPEHKARFLKGGKHYTPLIKEFVIVDFRGPGFRQARNADQFIRPIVSFNENYSSCSVSAGGKCLGKV